jgi:hypothetical protein
LEDGAVDLRNRLKREDIRPNPDWEEKDEA